MQQSKKAQFDKTIDASTLQIDEKFHKLYLETSDLNNAHEMLIKLFKDFEALTKGTDTFVFNSEGATTMSQPDRRAFVPAFDTIFDEHRLFFDIIQLYLEKFRGSLVMADAINKVSKVRQLDMQAILEFVAFVWDLEFTNRLTNILLGDNLCSMIQSYLSKFYDKVESSSMIKSSLADFQVNDEPYFVPGSGNDSSLITKDTPPLQVNVECITNEFNDSGYLIKSNPFYVLIAMVRISKKMCKLDKEIRQIYQTELAMTFESSNVRSHHRYNLLNVEVIAMMQFISLMAHDQDAAIVMEDIYQFSIKEVESFTYQHSNVIDKFLRIFLDASKKMVIPFDAMASKFMQGKSNSLLVQVVADINNIISTCILTLNYITRGNFQTPSLTGPLLAVVYGKFTGSLSSHTLSFSRIFSNTCLTSMLRNVIEIPQSKSNLSNLNGILTQFMMDNPNVIIPCFLEKHLTDTSSNIDDLINEFVKNPEAYFRRIEDALPSESFGNITEASTMSIYSLFKFFTSTQKRDEDQIFELVRDGELVIFDKNPPTYRDLLNIDNFVPQTSVKDMDDAEGSRNDISDSNSSVSLNQSSTMFNQSNMFAANNHEASALKRFENNQVDDGRFLRNFIKLNQIQESVFVLLENLPVTDSFLKFFIIEYVYNNNEEGALRAWAQRLLSHKTFFNNFRMDTRPVNKYINKNNSVSFLTMNRFEVMLNAALMGNKSLGYIRPLGELYEQSNVPVCIRMSDIIIASFLSYKRMHCDKLHPELLLKLSENLCKICSQDDFLLNSRLMTRMWQRFSLARKGEDKKLPWRVTMLVSENLEDMRPPDALVYNPVIPAEIQNKFVEHTRNVQKKWGRSSGMKSLRMRVFSNKCLLSFKETSALIELAAKMNKSLDNFNFLVNSLYSERTLSRRLLVVLGDHCRATSKWIYLALEKARLVKMCTEVMEHKTVVELKSKNPLEYLMKLHSQKLDCRQFFDGICQYTPTACASLKVNLDYLVGEIEMLQKILAMPIIATKNNQAHALSSDATNTRGYKFAFSYTLKEKIADISNRFMHFDLKSMSGARLDYLLRFYESTRLSIGNCNKGILNDFGVILRELIELQRGSHRNNLYEIPLQNKNHQEFKKILAKRRESETQDQITLNIVMRAISSYFMQTSNFSKMIQVFEELAQQYFDLEEREDEEELLAAYRSFDQPMKGSNSLLSSGSAKVAKASLLDANKGMAPTFTLDAALLSGTLNKLGTHLLTNFKAHEGTNMKKLGVVVCNVLNRMIMDTLEVELGQDKQQTKKKKTRKEFVKHQMTASIRMSIINAMGGKKEAGDKIMSGSSNDLTKDYRDANNPSSLVEMMFKIALRDMNNLQNKDAMSIWAFIQNLKIDEDNLTSILQRMSEKIGKPTREVIDEEEEEEDGDDDDVEEEKSEERNSNSLLTAELTSTEEMNNHSGSDKKRSVDIPRFVIINSESKDQYCYTPFDKITEQTNLLCLDIPCDDTSNINMKSLTAIKTSSSKLTASSSKANLFKPARFLSDVEKEIDLSRAFRVPSLTGNMVFSCDGKFKNAVLLQGKLRLTILPDLDCIISEKKLWENFIDFYKTLFRNNAELVEFLCYLSAFASPKAYLEPVCQILTTYHTTTKTSTGSISNDKIKAEFESKLSASVKEDSNVILLDNLKPISFLWLMSGGNEYIEQDLIGYYGTRSSSSSLSVSATSSNSIQKPTADLGWFYSEHRKDFTEFCMNYRVHTEAFNSRYCATMYYILAAVINDSKFMIDKSIDMHTVEKLFGASLWSTAMWRLFMCHVLFAISFLQYSKNLTVASKKKNDLISYRGFGTNGQYTTEYKVYRCASRAKFTLKDLEGFYYDYGSDLCKTWIKEYLLPFEVGAISIFLVQKFSLTALETLYYYMTNLKNQGGSILTLGSETLDASILYPLLCQETIWNDWSFEPTEAFKYNFDPRHFTCFRNINIKNLTSYTGLGCEIPHSLLRFLRRPTRQIVEHPFQTDDSVKGDQNLEFRFIHFCDTPQSQSTRVEVFISNYELFSNSFDSLLPQIPAVVKTMLNIAGFAITNTGLNCYPLFVENCHLDQMSGMNNSIFRKLPLYYIYREEGDFRDIFYRVSTESYTPSTMATTPYFKLASTDMRMRFYDICMWGSNSKDETDLLNILISKTLTLLLTEESNLNIEELKKNILEALTIEMKIINVKSSSQGKNIDIDTEFLSTRESELYADLLDASTPTAGISSLVLESRGFDPKSRSLYIEFMSKYIRSICRATEPSIKISADPPILSDEKKKQKNVPLGVIRAMESSLPQSSLSESKLNHNEYAMKCIADDSKIFDKKFSLVNACAPYNLCGMNLSELVWFVTNSLKNTIRNDEHLLTSNSKQVRDFVSILSVNILSYFLGLTSTASGTTSPITQGKILFELLTKSDNIKPLTSSTTSTEEPKKKIKSTTAPSTMDTMKPPADTETRPLLSPSTDMTSKGQKLRLAEDLDILMIAVVEISRSIIPLIADDNLSPSLIFVELFSHSNSKLMLSDGLFTLQGILDSIVSVYEKTSRDNLIKVVQELNLMLEEEEVCLFCCKLLRMKTNTVYKTLVDVVLRLPLHPFIQKDPNRDIRLFLLQALYPRFFDPQYKSMLRSSLISLRQYFTSTDEKFDNEITLTKQQLAQIVEKYKNTALSNPSPDYTCPDILGIYGVFNLTLAELSTIYNKKFNFEKFANKQDTISKTGQKLQTQEKLTPLTLFANTYRRSTDNKKKGTASLADTIVLKTTTYEKNFINTIQSFLA